MSWSLRAGDSALAPALLFALGRREVGASPLLQQKGDVAAGLRFRDLEGSMGMPATQAPASANRQGREVLTEIGWKFFSFKIPNLIIHNPLASRQPAPRSLAAGKCCLISRLNFSTLIFQPSS